MRDLTLYLCAGRSFILSPGALSILAYDPVEDARAVASWNDRAHLDG